MAGLEARAGRRTAKSLPLGLPERGGSSLTDKTALLISRHAAEDHPTGRRRSPGRAATRDFPLASDRFPRPPSQTWTPGARRRTQTPPLAHPPHRTVATSRRTRGVSQGRGACSVGPRTAHPRTPVRSGRRDGCGWPRARSAATPPLRGTPRPPRMLQSRRRGRDSYGSGNRPALADQALTPGGRPPQGESSRRGDSKPKLPEAKPRHSSQDPGPATQLRGLARPHEARGQAFATRLWRCSRICDAARRAT